MSRAQPTCRHGYVECAMCHLGDLRQQDEDWRERYDSLSESHANAVCALMTAQAENARLKDALERIHGRLAHIRDAGDLLTGTEHDCLAWIDEALGKTMSAAGTQCERSEKEPAR